MLLVLIWLACMAALSLAAGLAVHLAQEAVYARRQAAFWRKEETNGGAAPPPFSGERTLKMDRFELAALTKPLPAKQG